VSRRRAVRLCYFAAIAYGHLPPRLYRAVRKVGEMLAEQDVPRQPPGQWTDAEEQARLRLQAAASNARELVEYLPGVSWVVDLEEGREQTEETERLYDAAEDAARHLLTYAAEIDAALAGGAADPAEAFRAWLREMAARLRLWGPETRRIADRMLPHLPDAATREAMMEEDSETPLVSLYHWTASVTEALAAAVVTFERVAADPKAPADEGEEVERIHREMDPEAYPAGAGGEP
jgi:hypothetical protein